MTAGPTRARVPGRLRWRDWPWAAKLALLLGGLALLPLTVVTFYNAASARTELIAATRAQNLQQARNTAEAIDRFLEDVRADLSLVALSPATVLFFADTPDPALIDEVALELRQMRDHQGFDALSLIDAGGTVRLATDERMAGRSYLSAPWFLNAIAGNTALDEPRWDRADGKVYVHVSAPVREAGGRTLGAVVGRIPMSGLDALLRSDTGFAGRGEYGVLWDADGIRLSHSVRPGLRFRPLERLPTDVAARLAGENRFGPATRRLLAVPRPAAGLVKRSRWLLYDAALDPHVRLAGPDGSPVHVAVAPLRSARWLYGIFSPESAILSSVREETRHNLLFATMTAIFAIALAFFAARWAVRPLARVGETANAIARGDMSRRVGLAQRDEVGRLAAAFDAMADALSAKDAELRGYADRLEQRVAEQTAALRRSAAELRELYEREQEARRKAEEANRIKDDFLSTVSHELRTPLNAILGWVWLLNHGKLGTEEARRALATIERNARAQGQIIDDLLDVSRIITGKLRIETAPVNLVQVIEAALDSARPAAEAKGIRIERRLDPLASLVTGDPNRLQQVVWNLLSNAVKFTPEGGAIEVHLARAGSHTEIRVRDTGVGIPPHFLDHVFDRFRQADSSTTRAHGGLGLGLAIVRHLVELHGGTVAAESAGEGKGATFTVRLPVAPELRLPELEPVPERSGVSTPAAGHDLEGLRVLFVDDEADAREVLPAVLERFGADVRVTASTPEALETLPGFAPDVLVSDIAMPGEDGYSLIRKVRALDGRLGGIPAIALTAHAGDVARQRALAEGFQIHLAKPVEPRELVAAVAAVTRGTLPWP